MAKQRSSRSIALGLPGLLALAGCLALAGGLPASGAVAQSRASAPVAKIVGTVGVGIGPSGVSVDQADGTVWVANLAVGTISELSDSSGKVLHTLPVAGSPEAVAADPARGLIWVTNYTSAGSVWEISAASHRVISRIPAGTYPDSLTVDSRAGLVWVASPTILTEGTRVILAISEKTGKVVRRVTFGTAAEQSATLGLSAAPAAGLLYVSWISNLSQYQVSVVNESTGKITKTIALPTVGISGYFGEVGATPAGVWIVQQFDSVHLNLAWLATGTGQLTKTIKLPGVANQGANNFFAALADPRTSQAWIIRGSNKTFAVVIVNLRSGALQAVLQPNSYVQDLALDTQSGRGYLTEYVRGKLMIIQGQAPPTITTPAALSATAGAKTRLVIKAAGYPVPALSKSGALPPGLTATASRGALLISGVPARRDRGRSYKFTVTAANGLSPAASQVMRIEVR